MILILKAYQDLCVEACVTHFWESKLLPREDFCSRVCLKKNRLSLLMVERIPRQNKLQYLIINQSSSVPLKKYFNICEKNYKNYKTIIFFPYRLYRTRWWSLSANVIISSLLLFPCKNPFFLVCEI